MKALLKISILLIFFGYQTNMYAACPAHTLPRPTNKVEKKLQKWKERITRKIAKIRSRTDYDDVVWVLLLLLVFFGIVGGAISFLINLLIGSPMPFWLAILIGFALGAIIFIASLIG